jgi:hypothetical protein
MVYYTNTYLGNQTFYTHTTCNEILKKKKTFNDKNVSIGILIFHLSTLVYTCIRA